MHQAYPVRGRPERVINDPYEVDEAQYFQVIAGEPFASCVMLIQSPKCPGRCTRYLAQWKDCLAVECLVHAEYKLFD
jgi:hypothetical protein